jgi:hypothetical protein
MSYTTNFKKNEQSFKKKKIFQYFTPETATSEIKNKQKYREEFKMLEIETSNKKK